MSIQSNDSELTVLPSLTITEQPQDIRTAVNINAEFSVTAVTSDNRYTIQYYWTVDGVRQDNSNSRIFLVSSTVIGEKKVRAYASITIESIDDGLPIKSVVEAISDEATWNVGPPRSIIRFEGFTPTGGYKAVDANLDDGDVTLDDTMFDNTYNIVTYYAREKDLDLTMFVDGAPGIPASSGGQGGEGGKSTATLRHPQNIEHTVLGTTNNSAIFLYQGSQLLLVNGQGGSGGQGGTGADGGGTNISGGTIAGATGGQAPAIGSLLLNGTFGSRVTPTTVLQGDGVATTPNGGKTISCSKGNVWTSQGISPCEDNSTNQIKFRISTGGIVDLSDEIIRGFKPGYTLTSTEGAPVTSSGGKGGRGATGGAGASGTGGGGGGSGYSNGTVNIVITQLGGVPTTEKAKIRFSLVPPPPPATSGVVTHGFINSTNNSYLLNATGAIVDIEALGAGAADQQTGQGNNLKRYVVTLNKDYTNISVRVLQDVTAGGGPGMGLRATKVQRIGFRTWGIWFNKSRNGFNTFARNWSVSGS
jgi:hypothetical protein